MKRISNKNIIIGVFFLFMVLIIHYNGQILNIYSYFRDPEIIKNWLLSFGKMSTVVFILLQIFQVVVFFIPGEIVQAAGGFVYGTIMGTILSFIGILIGSVITFYLTRKYGLKIIRKIMRAENYKKLIKLLNKPKNKIILFTLYVIPGIPKDSLGFVAGVTNISMVNFIILSMIGRIPGILLMNYLGASISSHSYIRTIIMLLVTVLVFITGIWKKDSIIDYISQNRKINLKTDKVNLNNIKNSLY